MSLVMDLRVPHDRVGSSDDTDLNGHLRYPNNLDQSLNDTLLINYVNIAMTTILIRPGV